MKTSLHRTLPLSNSMRLLKKECSELRRPRIFVRKKFRTKRRRCNQKTSSRRKNWLDAKGLKYKNRRIGQQPKYQGIDKKNMFRICRPKLQNFKLKFKNKYVQNVRTLYLKSILIRAGLPNLSIQSLLASFSNRIFRMIHLLRIPLSTSIGINHLSVWDQLGNFL